eukprot:m.492757 g.492757  ORF g.492757 m.492757 type:complete len:683 (+) comp34009_c0_seq1:317-2365(+)
MGAHTVGRLQVYESLQVVGTGLVLISLLWLAGVQREQEAEDFARRRATQTGALSLVPAGARKRFSTVRWAGTLDDTQAHGDFPRSLDKSKNSNRNDDDNKNKNSNSDRDRNTNHNGNRNAKNSPNNNHNNHNNGNTNRNSDTPPAAAAEQLRRLAEGLAAGKATATVSLPAATLEPEADGVADPDGLTSIEGLNVRPPIKYCARAEQLPQSTRAHGATLLGCFAPLVGGRLAAVASTTTVSAAACQQRCNTTASDSGSSPRYVLFDGKTKACGCARDLPAVLRGGLMHGAVPSSPAHGPGALQASPAGCMSASHPTAVYALASWPPIGPWQPSDRVGRQVQRAVGDTVTVFLFVSERLASLFHTCRLTRFSDRFNYRVFDLRHQMTQDEVLQAFLPQHRGLRLMVYNSCCTNGTTLQHWPPRSLLVVAGDESARWGFAHHNGRNWWGPHGPHGPLPSDGNRTMIMPKNVNPWFKQYFSSQHVEQYGNTVRFLPLGSRLEFPEPRDSFKPATDRKYLYSFMGAPTNHVRRRLKEILTDDNSLNKAKRFLHLADKWSTDPNDPTNTYINSTQYHHIMSESVFTLCPKGQSVEQYRVYEALECGSIPVFCYEGKLLAERMPPEFLESPMLFVDSWDNVTAAMKAVADNGAELLRRQAAVSQWYKAYMRAKIIEVEDALLGTIEKN